MDTYLLDAISSQSSSCFSSITNLLVWISNKLMPCTPLQMW
jgi:hypothetical protein